MIMKQRKNTETISGMTENKDNGLLGFPWQEAFDITGDRRYLDNRIFQADSRGQASGKLCAVFFGYPVNVLLFLAGEDLWTT